MEHCVAPGPPLWQGLLPPSFAVRSSTFIEKTEDWDPSLKTRTSARSEKAQKKTNRCLFIYKISIWVFRQIPEHQCFNLFIWNGITYYDRMSFQICQETMKPQIWGDLNLLFFKISQNFSNSILIRLTTDKEQKSRQKKQTSIGSCMHFKMLCSNLQSKTKKMNNKKQRIDRRFCYRCYYPIIWQSTN